jgi:hypothetical protein
MLRIFLWLIIIAEAQASWTSAPPSTMTLNASATISASGSWTAATPTFLILWKYSPSGTWSKTICTSTAATSGSGSGTFSPDALGTWKVQMTAETTATGTAPSGTTIGALTSIVVTSPVTFTFSGGPAYTYNGSNRTITVSASPTAATFTKTGTWTAASAGSYTATATASGSYTGTSSYSWSIAKASQTISFANPGTKTYGAAAFGLGATATSGLAVTYSASGPASLSGSTLTITGVGTVSVTAAQAGNSNWNAASSVTQTFTVNPVATTFTYGGGPSYSYDGSVKTVTLSVSPANATFTTGGTYSATNAGSYTATATATGNYSGSNSYGWSIAKISQNALTLAAPSALAYGASATLSVSGGSGAGAVTYAITGQSAAGVATLSGATLTAASGTGWVDVQATKAADTNYTVQASSVLRVNLSQVPVTFTFSGGPMFTYDGTAKSVNFTANPAAATFAQTGTYTATEAGSYAAAVTATGNYSGGSTYSWSIGASPQNPAITLTPVADLPYGLNCSLSITGGSGAGAITYAIVSQSAAGNATLVGSTLTANASSGWVDLQATKAGDGNFDPSISAIVRVNFVRSPVTFTFSGGPFSYDGASHGITVAVTPAAAGSSYTASGTYSAVAAGSYTATATATGNYVGSNSYVWAIDKINQPALTLNASDSQAFSTIQIFSTAGGAGTGAVSYAIVASSAAGVASLSSSTLTASSSAGWVDVQATKVGDTNYNAVSSVLKRITFSPLPVTFTFSGGPGFVFNNTTKTVVLSVSPIGATFTTSGVLSASAIGSYVATATATGNYTGTLSYEWSVLDGTKDSDADGILDGMEVALEIWKRPTTPDNATNSATQLKILTPQ